MVIITKIAHLHPLSDVWFPKYAPKMRLLLFKRFWLRDISRKVGQNPKGTCKPPPQLRVMCVSIIGVTPISF